MQNSTIRVFLNADLRCSHVKPTSGRVVLESFAELPAAFGATAEMKYTNAVRKVLTEALERKRRARGQ